MGEFAPPPPYHETRVDKNMAEVKDVTMKEVPEEGKDGKGDEDADQQPKTKKDKDVLTVEDIREQIRLIERGLVQKETRYIHRCVRSLLKLRKQLNDNVLWRIVNSFYHSGPLRESLVQFIEEPMETEGASKPQSSRARSSRFTSSSLIPEVDVFIHLLVLLKLLDNSDLERAKLCSDQLTHKLTVHNRRSLDPLSAKCYFYHSRVYELLDQLSSVRSFLYARLRSATLHRDENSQAVLLNLLLRNFLHYNLYEQANKLISKSTFPASANNSEFARYLFYVGRIRAIQLDYTEAYQHLVQAIRKAPQQSAIGFRQTAHKFAVVVQLLLGEIPDRATFKEAVLSKPLRPYFQITQAVRNGDLVKFNQVLEMFTGQFQQEKTYALIVRLRHNVIKTGIRTISLSYSRVSLKDIAAKLQLDNPIDAEYIIAKAIKDGVIEASINHEEGYMHSSETTDIYSTKEPMETFHQRVHFCLELFNQSIKAMRYPPKAYKKDLETAEEMREKEQATIELAKEMADEEDDDF